jgi:hypothetical protein
MTHTDITHPQLVDSLTTMGGSTPAASDRPYLTVREVLRAGMRRAARRKEIAAAQSMQTALPGEGNGAICGEVD